MDENKDFKVINIPAPSFVELTNIEKGDLGEKFVEICLKVFYLVEGKDFVAYVRTESYKKRTNPDFSDEFKEKQKTFEIEVKNLGLNSDVSIGWIKQNLPEYWFESCDFQKVLIIFGGNIHQDVPVMLEKEGIIYIHHEKPVEAKDYFDLVWWLKDELLEVSSIREKVIAAINREFYHNNLKFSKTPIWPLLDDKLLLAINYDESKSCHTLRSFPKRDWQSQEEIYKSAISGVYSSHEWEVKLEEL